MRWLGRPAGRVQQQAIESAWAIRVLFTCPWAEQAAEELVGAVILSEAKNLCICLKIQMQGSFASLRMTASGSFSAACKAPPFQFRGEKSGLRGIGKEVGYDNTLSAQRKARVLGDG